MKWKFMCLFFFQKIVEAPSLRVFLPRYELLLSRPSVSDIQLQREIFLSLFFAKIDSLLTLVLSFGDSSKKLVLL